MGRDEQGVALIERVIEQVSQRGFGQAEVADIRAPRPVPTAALETLRFPCGQRPSPSLLRWLAFDVSWLANLGWFEDAEHPVFTPRRLADFAADEFGREHRAHFAGMQRRLPGELYLLPLGDQSRRALYVGEPDTLGEHPIIVLDVDDMPYVTIEYPGFDVYMAHLAGVLELEFETYESLHDEPAYAVRMAAHTKWSFGGQPSYEYEGDEPGVMHQMPDEPPPWREGDPVPEGYAVLKNPFTKQSMLMPMPKPPWGTPRN